MKCRACDTYWGEYDLKGRLSLEGPGLGGNIVLEWRGMKWIHLAPNRAKWWAVMNMVMNVQVETIIQYHRKSAALRFTPNSTVQGKTHFTSLPFGCLVEHAWYTDDTANASCLVQI